MERCERLQKKHPRGRRIYSKKVRGLVITAISILGILSMAFIGGGAYIWSLLGKVQYIQPNTDDGEYSLLPEADGGSYASEDVISDYTVIQEGAANVADIEVKGNTKTVTNYLLCGVETNNQENYIGRSDSNIILTLNSQNKTIKLTSILRDTLVTVPGKDENGDGRDDYAKFNASFARNRILNTIQQNFRMKIDKYLAVNFSAFAIAVNAMGGLDMPLTGDEAKIVEVGHADATYHLDGDQTLNYARIRVIGNDYARADRQRKVIAALIAKAKTMNLGVLGGVLDKTFPKVSTNMTKNELAGFVYNSIFYSQYTVKGTYQFPEPNGFKGAYDPGLGDVLVLTNPAESVIKMQQFIYNN